MVVMDEITYCPFILAARSHNVKGILTRRGGTGMMCLPQVGRTVTALHARAEESPHSIERGAGEIPGRGNLPDRATENK